MDFADPVQFFAVLMCLSCLVPLVLFFIALRLALMLEQVTYRHPLLLWIVPAIIVRKARKKQEHAEATERERVEREAQFSRMYPVQRPHRANPYGQRGGR